MLGPQSHQDLLHRRTALVIVGEASMLEWKLFEMVEVALKGSCSYSQCDSPLRFYGIFIVFDGDYSLLISGSITSLGGT